MFTRRDLLLSSLGASALGWGLSARRARAATGSAPRRVVLVTALGGWDTTVALDPKRTGDHVDGPELDSNPDDPDDVEEIQTFHGLDIGVNAARRPAVTAFFEAWGHRCLLLRGLDMGTISHTAATTRILTGRREAGGPDLGALSAERWGQELALPYVDLGSAGRPGPLTTLVARTGLIGQARYLLDRGLNLPAPGGPPLPRHRTAPGFESTARTWLDARADALVSQRLAGRGASRLEALPDARARAHDLQQDGRRIAGLMYDGLQRSFADQVDAAIALLTDGLAWSVAVDSTLNFDTHTNNTEQHRLHDRLFADLKTLVDALDTHDLLDETVVVVASEFNRTPKRNSSGGKDHWPFTATLLLGGGIAGGRVWGGTDDRVAGWAVDRHTGEPDPTGSVPRFDQLIAGLMDGLDVDRAQWLPGTPSLGGLFA